MVWTEPTFNFCRNLPFRPGKPERLFFALFPDKEAALHITRVADGFVRTNQLRGRRLSRDRLHVSLHHFGDFKNLSPEVLSAADQVAEAVSLGPVEITLYLIGTFRGAPARRSVPLVLLGKGKGLEELHGALGTAMKRNGRKASAYITPHMTLLYGSQQVLLQPIEAIRFTATEFALVHSERGLSRYTLIRRWPLQGSSRSGRDASRVTMNGVRDLQLSLQL